MAEREYNFDLWCDQCGTKMKYDGWTEKVDQSCIQERYRCPVCNHITIAFPEESQEESLIKASKALVDFIEDNDITDESADDGGCIDEWRSGEFDNLIDNVKKAIAKP